MNERSDEEQRLADLLKRAVPEPLRQLTHEEISMRHLERSVKPWLMPAMAAASVLVIGGAIGAVAATRPHPATPRASAAASQDNGAVGVQVTGSGCLGTAVPIPSASPTAPPGGNVTVPPGGNVTVPMVTGFTAGRAEQVLTQAGLFVFVQTAPAHGTPAGTVLRQAPAPGTRAPSGAVVVIIVAIKTGGPVPATSPAPSATAIPIPSATASATAAPSPYPTCSASATPVPSSAPSSSPSVVPTVTPAPVTSAPVTPVPTGKPGVAPSVTPVPTGKPGVAPSVTAVPTTRASVTVPNVVGMQQTQAQTVLQLAGFNVLVFPNAPEPSGRPRGTIFKQSPAPGTVVPRGSQIAIYG